MVHCVQSLSPHNSMLNMSLVKHSVTASPSLTSFHLERASLRFRIQWQHGISIPSQSLFTLRNKCDPLCCISSFVSRHQRSAFRYAVLSQSNVHRDVVWNYNTRACYTDRPLRQSPRVQRQQQQQHYRCRAAALCVQATISAAAFSSSIHPAEITARWHVINCTFSSLLIHVFSYYFII